MAIMIVMLMFLVWLILVSAMTLRMIREPTDKIKKKNVIDKLIERSGITSQLKFYNTVLHIVLSVLFFMVSFSIARLYLGKISSLIFCVLIGSIPTILLGLLNQNKVSATRRETVNFIDIFSNQIVIHNNIFNAMSDTVKYVNNPVKDIVLHAIELYEKKVDPVKCLKYISSNLSGVEVKSFFENLEYFFIEGGDVTAINEEFLLELTELIEIDEKEKSEDLMLNMMIYALISADVFGVLMILLSSNSRLLTNSLYGEIALSINMAICIVLVIQTIVKQGDIE